MPWRAAYARARLGSRAAMAVMATSGTDFAGVSSAVGTMRAAPRTPMRRGGIRATILHGDGESRAPARSGRRHGRPDPAATPALRSHDEARAARRDGPRRHAPALRRRAAAGRERTPGGAAA